MDAATKAMVKGWLVMHEGDVEGLSRWMRDSLHIANLTECRQLVLAATGGKDDE